MGFLKRLFGGGEAGEGEAAATSDSAPTAQPGLDEAERERERLRAEAMRLDDELIQRQMRYADRSWTPPAQGGTRRADDEADADG